MNEQSWQEQDGVLYRKFDFDHFSDAMEFVQQVGLCAEDLGHHPDIKISFNSVELRLTTHDKGNVVTKKDRELAEAIDALRG